MTFELNKRLVIINGENSSGSAILINNQGLVISCYHNFYDKQNDQKVIKSLSIKTEGFWVEIPYSNNVDFCFEETKYDDLESDDIFLFRLKIDKNSNGIKDLPKLSVSRNVKQGDEVTVIAWDNTYDKNFVEHQGKIISVEPKTKDHPNRFHIKLDGYPGYSGGGVFKNGELVGIINYIQTQRDNNIIGSFIPNYVIDCSDEEIEQLSSKTTSNSIPPKNKTNVFTSETKETLVGQNVNEYKISTFPQKNYKPNSIIKTSLFIILGILLPALIIIVLFLQSIYVDIFLPNPIDNKTNSIELLKHQENNKLENQSKKPSDLLVETIVAGDYHYKVISSKEPIFLWVFADFMSDAEANVSVLEAFIKEHGNKIKIMKLNSKLNKNLAFKLEAALDSNLILYSKGKEVGRITGVASVESMYRLMTDNLVEFQTEGKESLRLSSLPKLVEPLIETDYEDKVLSSKLPILLWICTDYYESCDISANVILHVAKEYSGKIKVMSLDWDINYTLSSELSSFEPTLIMYKDGEELEKLVGTLSREATIKFINSSLSKKKVISNEKPSPSPIFESEQYKHQDDLSEHIKIKKTQSLQETQNSLKDRNIENSETSKPPSFNNLGNNVINLVESDFTEEVLSSKIPVLIWVCRDILNTCEFNAPKVNLIANKYLGKLKVMKLDWNINRELARKLSNSEPALILYKNGRELHRLQGAVSENAILSLVDKIKE